MGKIVMESKYRRFAPVGQNELCADCPSSCKTSCVRLSEQERKLDIENDFANFQVVFEKGGSE